MRLFDRIVIASDSRVKALVKARGKQSSVAAVDRDTLPPNAKETHVSLLDGSNCGVALTDRPAFSVQYHPEASPGPRDSHDLFRRLVNLMEAAKEGETSAA